MNFKDITDRLSAQQKKKLKNAKTKEELDGIFTSEIMQLTDDQLGKVSGGGCFVPLYYLCEDCHTEFIIPAHPATSRQCPGCGGYNCQNVEPGYRPYSPYGECDICGMPLPDPDLTVCPYCNSLIGS